ncbi:MAG: NAD(P)H-binding protein [Chitinophagaceae bacterium]
MNILVTGATGMVGAEVIRQAIVDDGITTVTAIARKPLSIEHPKLTTVIHDNFIDYSALAPVFAKHDACLWCLGISQLQVSKQEYEVITYDYAVAAAKAMLQANPNIHFLFVSGEGADSTGQTRTLFGRIKGKTENALLQIGFNKLYLARPGAIRPIHQNPNAPFLYKVMIPLFPLMELLTPGKVINSVQLAKALLHIVKTQPEQVMFNNRELKLKASPL